MEAPEKIYIIPHTLTDGFFRRLFEEPFKRECIEYVRKDAFIEKSISYIQQHWIWNTKTIEDFKKYMEDET